MNNTEFLQLQVKTLEACSIVHPELKTQKGVLQWIEVYSQYLRETLNPVLSQSKNI